MPTPSPAPVPDSPLSAEVEARNAALLRRCTLALVLAGIACLVVAAAADGSSGLKGAAIGAVMVLVFFGVDLLVFRATRFTPPIQVLAVVAMVYMLKITLLAVFLVALRGTDTFSVRSFGAAVIALTGVALGAAIVLVAKREVPLVEPDAGSGGASPHNPGSIPPASVES